MYPSYNYKIDLFLTLSLLFLDIIARTAAQRTDKPKVQKHLY